ncbi:YdcF family protein (plasmid) [Pontibacillus sp. ALD_SL1]|uniref:YdcF family protein n=1 Tax=Pontibacillus sp. ALD_SL1 TaxID=2777185 RepID=UPI001A96CB59|nr:YdcF family protein [Pontibacillus sp. ALD_SL1]QST02483.1 YdcF family protein [Pontibacillus sp. ALD_SL1]
MYDLNADAKLLWDYHHLHHNLSKKDCILAFGSHDLHVAERAAELYNQGFAECVMFTGGLGKITKNTWEKTEAEMFTEVAIERGVPKDKIFLETESTNTGQNIAFTKKLIEKEKLTFSDYIVVDKPFKERRIYATLKKQWPALDFIVTSPQASYKAYCRFYNDSEEFDISDFINIMVGDLQRIDLYGENGFQIPQDIPKDVMEAYKRLVRNGFDRQLIQG